jgi:cell surface protein SprA
VGEFYRDLADTSGNKRLILKMLKPKNLYSNGPNYRVAWNQLLKNIYTLPGRNIKKTGFELDIFRRAEENAEDQNSIFGQRLLRVFGLDQYNADNTVAENGDGLFDFREGKTINPGRAEIIFPSLRPFDLTIVRYFTEHQLALPDSSFYFPRIYDTTRTFASQDLEHDRYRIRGKATGEATSKYNLGFNVVEGSVQVLLNGNRLTPNVDYTVDYIVGEIVIRNDRALVPGANLQIKYEHCWVPAEPSRFPRVRTLASPS